MPGPIHVPHCVPVTYVPPRARNARLAFAPVVTPVELREVDAREAPVAAPVGGLTLPLRLHDGALWTTFERLGGLDGLLRECRLWSAKPGTVGNCGSLALSLIARTPLAPQPHASLALADPPPHGARILRDGTERGTADLARYLDDNVVLVAGMPHVRLRGPLFERAGVDGPPELRLRHGLAAWRGTKAGTAAAAPRLAAHGLLLARHLPDGYAAIIRGTPLPEAFPPTRDRLDDVAHFLQAFAETLHDDQSLARSRDADGLLRPWLELGAFGAVRLEEAHDAFRDLGRACDLVESTHRLAGYAPPRSLERLKDYVAEIALPALEAPPSPDDEAALEGLYAREGGPRP